MTKKVRLVLLFVMTGCGFCWGQVKIEWQKTMGGNDQEDLFSIRPTLDGGCILGGDSESNISGDKTENCSGFNDYWIVKLDAFGNIQWDKTIGGSDLDYLYAVRPTNDGGYILAGNSSSNISGDKTEDCIGSLDYWIVKLDGIGNIVWQNTIGGNSGDILFSVEQTNDNGYVIGGYSYSNASGDKSENNFGVINMWIVKLDSVGNIQWENTIGGSSDDRCLSIFQKPNGEYILIASSHSGISGDKTENSFGWEDYWIVKLDSAGNIIAQNNIGGNDRDFGITIKPTSDGGYIAGGTSGSGISGDKSEMGYGNMDYWVIKLDSALNILWQKTLGGNSGEQFYSIDELSNGDFLVGGFSYSGISGNKTVGNNGGADSWIVKLDNVGNIKSQAEIGGTLDDYAYYTSSLFCLTGDKFIIGCHSNSNISGDKSENSRGYADYWVVKGTMDNNYITGNLFSDLNNNQIHDSVEFGIPNKVVTELNTGTFTFSQQKGIYYLSLTDTGNFSVTPTPINYYNPIPAIHSAYFPSINQTDSLNDFAFQPLGVFNDLCLTISPLGPFRPGMNANYIISYENVGTTTLTPTVIFFPDAALDFVSANPVATSVTTDSVVWSLPSLLPFQTGNILVTVSVDTNAVIGALISSSAYIEPLAGDANTNCNYGECTSHITAAFDPNAILVNEDTLLTSQISTPAFLEYIIYFQNTGNDTAFNVRVLNNLPLNLDVTTFEFVASSHPLNISYGAHARLMTFDINNILLPDSNTNEPASHGFIRYKIKPLNTLVAGDIIPNTAFIYFDFNQPVQTNFAVTQIVSPTGLTPSPSPGERGALHCYPNPTTNELTITGYSFTANEKAVLSVFDVYGKEVLVQQLNASNAKLETRKLPQGIYFLQVSGLRAKFVKR